ncbi:MAG: serine hydrolase domain-containing protein [Saprospiraceae bacterium]
MKLYLPIIVSCLLVLNLMNCQSTPKLGADAISQWQESPAGKKMNEYLAAQVEKGYSGAVLVVKNGEILHHAGYGLADREKAIPNSIQTVFDIGSIMKDFTDVAILQLEAAGKLSTDDPLSRFFEQIPADKAAITIHQLLRHQSGLGEYHDTEGDFERMTYEEAMKRIFAQKLRFQPGSDQAYSNSGFTLLAAIIEKASGEAYMDYVRKHIIDPIGLQSAAFFGERERMTLDQVAIGYDGVNAGQNNNPFHRDLPQWQIMGAGGLVLTLSDLYHFALAIREGKLLPESGVQKFMEVYNPARPTDWNGPVRGLGGGSDVGFTVICLQFPEEDAYVLMASNTQKYGGFKMATPIAKILFGQEVVEEKEAPPFVAKNAAEWGLPETVAGKQAALYLNAICQNDPDAASAFVKTHFHPDLSKEHTEEDHINFMGMVFQEVGSQPIVKDIQNESDTTISFYLQASEGAELLKVHLGVKKDAPHQIFNILVGN